LDLTEAGFEAPRDGDLEHALTHLTDALEADNTDTRARKGLAAVSLEMGDKAAAVTAFNGIIFHTNDRWDVIDAYLSKARLLDELDHTDKARAHSERAPRQADHGLQQAGVGDEERPCMVLICGIAQHKSSLSIGPVSSFFKMLSEAEGQADPAGSALQQAVNMKPELADLLPNDPFEDPVRTAKKIREHMPRFPIPAYH
jgi:tetratricopeptide (TPR) repeat protein